MLTHWYLFGNHGTCSIFYKCLHIQRPDFPVKNTTNGFHEKKNIKLNDSLIKGK